MLKYWKIVISYDWIFFSQSLQVWSLNWYIWNGFLCSLRAPWLSCEPSPPMQVARWHSSASNKGGCNEMVPGEIWGCHPQQVSGNHFIEFDMSESWNFFPTAAPICLYHFLWRQELRYLSILYPRILCFSSKILLRYLAFNSIVSWLLNW